MKDDELLWKIYEIAGAARSPRGALDACCEIYETIWEHFQGSWVKAPPEERIPYYEIYTDGACSPNPGTGGWAAIIIGEDGESSEVFGAEPDSTNNRMELLAVIKGILALTQTSYLEPTDPKFHIKLTTDSQYVCKAFTEGWLEGWKKRGWKNANKDPVKNQDLWKELDRIANHHQIEWVWVKGHADNMWNSAADELAVEARVSLQEELDEG